MYTEKQLVSFGNYLLGRYGVMVHSTDGKNVPLYQRGVTDADHCNWAHESKLDFVLNDDAEILEYNVNEDAAQAVRRLRDGVIFRLGDVVTNGTQMVGKLERFEHSPDSRMLFVYTDWSGIGMNLGSLRHAQQLPSAHQVGDQVNLLFAETYPAIPARVLAVHFFTGKVKYDLAIKVSGDENDTTRVYNVDSAFVINGIAST